MVGVSGTTTAGTVDAMVEAAHRESWYEREQYEDGDHELSLVHHGERDPTGRTVWRGDGAVGVVHGVVSNQSTLGLSDEALFERLLDRPTDILPQLSGPFLVAAQDGERTVVATDKLATRPCYYAETDDGVRFSSALSSVLTQVETAELNEQAISDMLSFGCVLGEKTLVEGIESLPPATMLQYEDGETTVQSYWQPSFGRQSADGYVDETARRFRQTLSNVADSLDGEVGLWLSGGLDSRTMATVLRDEHGPFQTFTYDHNPPDGSNLEPARATADHLGVENEFVEIRPGKFEERIEEGVKITDGMSSWVYFINPEFILNGLNDRVDIVFEGAPQGELFGEHVWYDHLDRSASATGALTRMLHNHRASAETVTSLLDADVDPDRSIRREAAKSDVGDATHRTMDVWFRNFCSNSHFRSKRLTRSQVGTRIPFADGEFIDHLAKMPHDRFRRDTVPLSGGVVPRSMSPLKRELVGALDPTLAEIPYERTGLAPSKPLVAHDAAYVSKKLREQVQPVPEPWMDWARGDSPVNSAMNGWLDSACDREIFNSSTIRQLQHELESDGVNHLRVLAAVASLEIWMDEYR